MLNTQAQLYLCLLAGVILGKLKLLSDTGRAELTDLVMNVTLPATIISSFVSQTFSAELMGQSLAAFIGAALLQAACVILGPVLFPEKRFAPEDRKIFRYSTINTNAAFIGLPIISGIYGDIGALVTSVALIPLRVTLWTAGISIFVEEKDLKKKIRTIALHPCMVAVYTGFLLMLLPVELPQFLRRTLSLMGGGTTFLSMLIVGYVVSQMDPRHFVTPPVLYYCFLRLIVIPGTVLLAMRLLSVDRLVTAVIVILAGVPAGSFTAMLAAKYHCNQQLAAKVILTSTILSVVTLPLLCLFL